MLWLCLFVGVAAVNQVSNDFCTGATSILTSSGSGSNVGAVQQTQTEGLSSGNDVFYKYTATTTGWATFAVTSSISLGIVVFNGASCAKLGRVDYYYNRSSYSNCGSSTDVMFPIFSGSTYYLAVGTYYSYAQGSWTWTFQTSTSTFPAGDSCRAPIAIPITGVQTVAITAAATKQDSSFYGYSDIFLTYAAPCTGLAVVTTSSTFDNALSVYFSQSCDDIIGLENALDQDEYGNATVSFPVWSGHSYVIAAGPSYGGYYGSLDVTVNCMAQTTAPNDVCPTAIHATTTFTTSTSNANTNFNYNLCESYSPQFEVWVNHTAACTGKLTLDINSTHVAILRGATCDQAQVIHCDSAATHTVDVTQGDQLFFAIGDYVGYDNYRGTLTCTPYNTAPPANTHCGTPSIATSAVQSFPTANSITDPLSNRATYLQGGYSCYSVYFTTFFNYTATCTGTATFNLNSTDTNWNLGFTLYQDSSCAANVEPAYCDDDFTSYGYGSFGPLNVNQNDVYYFGVSYYDELAVRTNIQVNVVCNPGSATSQPTVGSTGTPTTSGTGTPTTAGSTGTPTTSGTTGAPSKTPTMASNTGAPSKTPTGTPTTSGSSKQPTTGGSAAPSSPTTSSTAPTAPTATTTSGAGLLEFGFVSVFGFLLL